MTGSSETRGKTHGRTSHRVDRAETTARLHELRVARGLGATELARQAGVTRQTIYAIESGDFVPNTAVALKLAGLLEVSVEELFSLNAVSTVQPPGDFSVELLATGEGKHS